jgi:hypothetical protein
MFVGLELWSILSLAHLIDIETVGFVPRPVTGLTVTVAVEDMLAPTAALLGIAFPARVARYVLHASLDELVVCHLRFHAMQYS